MEIPILFGKVFLRQCKASEGQQSRDNQNTCVFTAKSMTFYIFRHNFQETFVIRHYEKATHFLIFFLTSIVTLLILLGSIWWKALGKHTPVSWQFGWYQVWNPKGYLSSRVSSKNENKWTKSISIAPVMVSWIHNLIFKKREHEWYVMYHIWWMQWYR